MTRKKRNFLNITFMIVIFFITIYVIFDNNDLNDVLYQIKQGNPALLAVSMVMMIASVFCESLIIYIMMRIMKEKISFLRSAKYSFIGFYYCAITPSASGGQPAQILYMKKDGYKVATSTIIIFTIVTVFKLVLLCFVGFTFIFNHKYVVDNLNGLTFFYILGFAVNLIFIIFIWLLIFKPSIVNKILKFVYNLMLKIRLIKKPEKIYNQLCKSMNEYTECADFLTKNIYILIPVTILTVLQRLLLFSISFVIYKYFGLSKESFFNILSLQVILNTAVDVLPVPGGIGASEAAFKILFEGVYMSALLVPAMLATRFVNFYLMLILSAVVSLSSHFMMIRNDFRREDIS